MTEENVAEAMREIRTALLEADVHVEVAREFANRVQQKAIGQEIIGTLKPEQVMVKVVHDELVELMGPGDPRIPFVTPGPTIVMLAGLQGSGKTTTCGKLANVGINIVASQAMAAGSDRFGMILWAKQEDYERAAETLGAGPAEM